MASNACTFRNLTLLLIICLLLSTSIDFNYPAVFNFGDSNSDTGGLISGLAEALDSPNGQIYFQKPSGRFCDGRLIIDFLSKYPSDLIIIKHLLHLFCCWFIMHLYNVTMDAMDLPFLNPYLDSIAAPSFRQGCNFAAAGSTILPATASYVSPFSFGIQVAQFFRFKSKVEDILAKTRKYDKYIPAQDYFQKALYMFDIGQNDLAGAFYSKTLDQILASIPTILLEFEHGIELDELGCVSSHNQASRLLNLQLRALCKKLQGQYPDANVTHGDIFTIKSNLIANYSRYVTAKGCNDSTEYVNWDGIHYTEAANQYVASQVLTGKYSDPPFADKMPFLLKRLIILSNF
ncbi:UNVERIFIED_CONTAM: GDSL esterase/lipase [Sesamum latifolium]|uniref:GDSL esterase/lipase n=1 Tax=Sesamum latifolium TaxID=2727402 RepID=A0AAW2SNN5_9LAMI